VSANGNEESTGEILHWYILVVSAITPYSCTIKLQYILLGDYWESVRPARLPVLTWVLSSVPPGTTSKIRSPSGPQRIQQLSRYSDWLRSGRSGIESRWGRDFPPFQTGPGAHPASCEIGTGSFPGVKCGRGVLLTTHSLPVPRSWKSKAIPLPTLWATPGL